MTELELILIGVAAVVGGAVNALAGGGTLITFPMLTAVGIPTVAANITNTVALCPGYLGATFAQIKDLSVNKGRLWLLGLTGALGGLAGGVLLLNTDEQTFRTLVPYLILLATGLLAIEGPIHRWHTRRVGIAGVDRDHEIWAILSVFLASIYGGYFGGGLSVIVLAVLALLSHDSLTQLNALKQFIAFCVNISAAIFFLFSGKVVWSAAVVMAIGTLAGGVLGGMLAGRIRPELLRWIVVVMGVAISIIYFVR
ncbi:MAG: sulfite exporter TauE/SafE family protein [Desulfomonilaceae bacterium]